MHKSTFSRIALLTLLSPVVFISSADAYQTYATSGTTSLTRTGACATCHGAFSKDNYLSLKDGGVWTAQYFNTRVTPPAWQTITSLHKIHRYKMGISCESCHNPTAGHNPPVYLDSSGGYPVNGVQEYTLSCGGCHSRAETGAGGAVAGAGLRQHHYRKGITNCVGCHPGDSNPATFTTVGENVLPPNYAVVDPARPQPPRPKDPCNADFGEDFTGSSLGLDNDGNLSYDLKDPACADKVPNISLSPAALMFGTVPTGTTKTLSTVIENTGVGPLNFKVIDRCAATSTQAATSTEFTWSPATPFTVAPGASVTLDVTYAPVDDGDDKGCLVITSNDPDTPTMELGLNQSASNIFIFMPAIVRPAP